MSAFKRLILALFALSGFLVYGILACYFFWTWPLHFVYSKLGNDVTIAIVATIAGIHLLGLLIIFLRALFSRKAKQVELAHFKGGTIIVSKEALVSQAQKLINQDPILRAQKVQVDIRNKRKVNVFAKVAVLGPVNLSEKGASLHNTLEQGLREVAGDALNTITLRFADFEDGKKTENLELLEQAESLEQLEQFESLEQHEQPQQSYEFDAYETSAFAATPEPSSETLNLAEKDAFFESTAAHSTTHSTLQSTGEIHIPMKAAVLNSEPINAEPKE